MLDGGASGGLGIGIFFLGIFVLGYTYKCCRRAYSRLSRPRVDAQARSDLVRSRVREVQKRIEDDETVGLEKEYYPAEILTYAKQRETELRKGIERREREEKDTSKGEPVWFSRHVVRGRLKHWVMYACDHKIELRRAELDAAGAPLDNLSGTRGTGDYRCNVEPFILDQAWHRQRQIAIETIGAPEIDEFYVCLIGWTRLDEKDIARIGQEEMNKFGSYNLVLNNCQDFLRRIAARVLVSEKAADYSWFADNTKTQYQRDQATFPPPQIIIRRQIDKALVAANAATRAAAAASGANARNQITLNTLQQMNLNNLNIQSINNVVNNSLNIQSINNQQIMLNNQNMINQNMINQNIMMNTTMMSC